MIKLVTSFAVALALATPAFADVSSQDVSSQDVSSQDVSARDVRRGILQNYLTKHPVASWDYDWTTAIFLYGAAASLPADEDVLTADQMRWALAQILKTKPPRITSPDLSAPSLAAVLLSQPGARDQAALDQIRRESKHFMSTEPLNQGGVFDHVGYYNRLKPWLPSTRWIVPSSVWADSSVMYALNGFMIALYEKDAVRRDIFVDQLLKIHALLWDSKTHLYKHAYYFRSKAFAPGTGYWARGNLWMSLAMLQVLERLPVRHPARETLVTNLRAHMSALRKSVDLTRGLRTILGANVRHNDFETTASALMAFVLMKGARLQLLSADDGRAGRTLSRSLLRLAPEIGGGARSVEGISCPTTASTITLYYTRVVGICRDESYGVGAFLLMLSEM